MTPLAIFLIAATPPPNLLLVTIDTLRADRVGCYGYAAGHTPSLDLLAREGLLVEDATVQVPQTRPSHASIFTGRFPDEHGLRDNFSPPLATNQPTLASILRSHGYRTAAFIGAYVLAASSGLDRGFQHFDDPFSQGRPGSALYSRPERPAVDVVDGALRWLRRPGPKPFFAWVHLFDPHAPYEPPPPWDRRFAEQPYDGEVAYADAQLGRLLAALEEGGLRSNTLVVVTSDHGEGLGEHGEDEHMLLVYDTTLRVPLLFSWPGVLPPGGRLRGQFRSVDLLPTLLELMRLPAAPTSGLSRAAFLGGGGPGGGRPLPGNESYAESLYGHLHLGYAPLRALRAEGWKFIDAPEPELYNLRDDPGERNNLFAVRGTVAQRMRERLRAREGATATPPLLTPDAGTLERLAALGYVGGVASGTSAVAGPDPKDKIREFQAYTHDVTKATRLLAQGSLDAALEILMRLAEGEIRSFEVEYSLGRALLRKGRHAEAAAALEQAQELLPRFGPVYLELARAYAGSGRLAQAEDVLARGQRADPKNAAFERERGILRHRQGDLPGAQRALETARAADLRDARTRLALSAVYRDRGALEGALAEAREATRLQAESVDARVALGVLLVSAGRHTEAAEAFDAALRLRGDDPDALFGRAELYLRAGQAADAQPLLERLLLVSPDYPGAAASLERTRRESALLPPGSVRLTLYRATSRAEAEDIARRVADNEVPLPAGTDLGIVVVEEMAEPLRTAAARLQPGDLSPPIETATGLVLLRRSP